MLPKYDGDSIVNLTSTLARARGGKTSYPILKKLPPKEIQKAKNILFIIIDGLPHHYVMQQKKSMLREYCRGSITSLCPSTTSNCIPMFLSGVPAQQSGMAGWFLHVKEFGGVIMPLRFMHRPAGAPFSMLGVKPKEWYYKNRIAKSMKGSIYHILGSDLVNSDFNVYYSQDAQIVPYEDFDGFLQAIKKTVKSHKRKKYIHAYWPHFDSLCHEYGLASAKVKRHFNEIDRALSLLFDMLKGTDTTVVLTADHGMVDIPKKNRIELSKHPKLADCLVQPLCGEPRFAYCYVRANKVAEFKKYVKNKLSHACKLVKSSTAIEKGWFGLGKPSKELRERVGDFILVMNDDYIIKDFTLGQRKKFHIGNHGGLSKDEMLVPLVVRKL